MPNLPEEIFSRNMWSLVKTTPAKEHERALKGKEEKRGYIYIPVILNFTRKERNMIRLDHTFPHRFF